MSGCNRARELFGAYWDDETTRAERDWLDAHFAACASCRAGYEELSRTLTAVASLPRHEAAPELAERALAAAKRRTTAPDRVFEPASRGWVPAAAAAGLVLVAALAFGPRLLHAPGAPAVADRMRPVAEPRLVAVATPAPASGLPAAKPATTATAISDSLFDHSEDVDFVLDPVTLRRGRAHTVAHQPGGIQGESAVITF